MNRHLDVKLIRESVPALLLALAADSIAGFFMDYYSRIFLLIPGLLMVLPALIDMRGNVYGAFISRLSSQLHLGEVETLNDKKVKIGIATAKSLAYSAGLTVALIAGLISYIQTGNPVFILVLPTIILVNHLFTASSLTPLTAYIGVKTYEKGWNPDNVGVPLLSSAGDLITVIFLILVGFLFLQIWHLPLLILGIAIIILIYVAHLLRIVWKDSYGRRIYRESIVVLIILAFVELFTGSVWEANKVGMILLLLPPTLETLGNLGSVFSSRLTSYIYLGYIEPTIVPRGEHARREIISILSLTGILYAIITPLIVLLSGDIKVIYVMWTAVLISVVSLIFIAYYLTIGSLRARLDPDNIVVPVITTLADIIGTLSIVFSYYLFF